MVSHASMSLQNGWGAQLFLPFHPNWSCKDVSGIGDSEGYIPRQAQEWMAGGLDLGMMLRCVHGVALRSYSVFEVSSALPVCSRDSLVEPAARPAVGGACKWHH